MFLNIIDVFLMLGYIRETSGQYYITIKFYNVVEIQHRPTRKETRLLLRSLLNNRCYRVHLTGLIDLY